MPFRPAKSRFGQTFGITRLAVLASASALSLTSLRAADTEIDVNANATDLTSAASYTPSVTPSSAYDITFTAGTTYTNPTGFTLNSSVAFGSLNDRNATALAISNTGGAADTLTLGGTGDVVTGSASADLLYVATGGNLTINGGSGNSALGIALAQSGNFDVAGTANISSAVSGAFAVTKTGNGTLTLSGANTFSGGLIYSAGTLKLGSSSVGTAGTVGSNGALTSSAVGTGLLTLGGNGFLGLDLNGQTLGNRFVITNNNDTVTNNSATTANVTGALDGSVNGGNISDFAVGGTGDILWTGQISRTSGTLGLTKNSANTVTFAQAARNAGIGTLLINSGTVGLGVTGTSAGAFSDSVTVAGGTLKFRPDLGIVSGGSNYGGQINSTITLNSGTVDLFGSTGQNSRVQQLIGSGGTVTNTSTTAAVLGISARDTNTTREFDGLIKDGAGTVALDFTSTGTTNSGRINYLTGANTYSGGTSIGFGTVRLGNNTALGTGLVTLQSNASATLDLNGFSFANNLANSITGATITNSSATAATVSTGFNPTGAGSFTISDFTINGTGDINFTGAIRRTNFNGTLTKSGTNTLTLAGAGGDYTGMGYTVSAGTLAFKLTGGTFNSGGITDNSAVVGAAVSGVTNTIANVISGTGTFTQNGAGTTILTQTNTFTGGTTVNAGVLQLNVGGGNGTLTGALTINSGGTVRTNAQDALGYSGGNGTVTTVNVNAGGVFDNGINNNNGYVTSFVLTGGSVTGSGGPAAAINFNPSTTNSVTSPTLSSLASPTTATFSAPIVLRSGTALPITVATGTTASGIDLNISGAIGQNNATGAIDKEGAGVLQLAGANTYTGVTTINGGTVQAGVASVAGTSGALGNGSAVTLANATNTTLALNGFNTQIGSLAGGGATGGNVTLGSGTLTTGQDGTSTSFAGVISGSGGLTKINGGTQELTRANTFTGPTAINGGTLKTSNSGTVLATSSSVTIASGATLDVNGNGTEVINNLSGAGTVTSSFSQQFSGVNLVNNTNTTFSGVLNGGLGSGGAVTKLGTGTLTLSGANTYSAATSVNVGTLLVNGSVTGAGNVSVASGATLGGGGSLAGTATVNGTVAPGTAAATIGMLTLTSTGGATIGASGIYLADLNATTSDNLRLSAGALTITSGATLTFNTLATPTATSYDLANYTSETGMFTVTNLPSGYTLSYGSTELDLVATAVPEPSTWTIGLLCLGTLGFRLRRRLGDLFVGRRAA